MDNDRDEARSAIYGGRDDDDRPTLAECQRDEADRPRPDPLPDPYLCVDPWCPSAQTQPRHLHGTRPDGVRV